MRTKSRCRRGHKLVPPNVYYRSREDGKPYTQCAFCFRSRRYEATRKELLFKAQNLDDSVEAAMDAMEALALMRYNEEAYLLWEADWTGENDPPFIEWLWEKKQVAYYAGEPLTPDCLRHLVAREAT